MRLGLAEEGQNDFLSCLQLKPQDIRPFVEIFSDYRVLIDSSKATILFNNFRRISFSEIDYSLWEEEIELLRGSLTLSFSEPISQREVLSKAWDEKEKKQA